MANRYPELTAQQRRYIDHRTKGRSRQESAIAAGYADWENVGDKVEESPAVQEELARVRAEMAVAGGVTRDDVVAGLKAAADMATTLADPLAMVRAWSELGKLLGFYAPEVKRLEKGINKNDLKRAMAQMSDAELQLLARGRVIDIPKSDFKREPDVADVPQLQARRD